MKEIFGLYLVLTDPITSYERCAQAAVANDVRYLQLRMKSASREEFLRTAKAIRAITQNTNTRFIVNDNLSIAIESDACGMHVGQSDMAVHQIRSDWSASGKIVGLSTHNEIQAQNSREQLVDYVGVGPVFATPTKATPDPVLGISRSAAIVRNSPHTAVAIGGLNETNLPSLFAAGVYNFAVVRAVCGSEQPEEAIAGLMELFRSQIPR